MVASPVEDYFLQLDGLPEPDRSAAIAVARPLLVRAASSIGSTPQACM
jgi:hypothetical protein